MLPTLELRDYWYTTGVTIFIYIFAVITNFSMIKKKTTMLGAPAGFVVERLSPVAQKHKILKPISSKYLWAVIEILLFSFTQFLPQPILNSGFGDLVGTGGNFFGFMYFSPLIMIGVFLLVWANPLQNMDYFTFSVPITLFFGKIGCFCAGCCNGVWWPGGFYNYATQREEIPIQLVEAAWAVLIFVFIIVYNKKAKNRKDGELFPLTLILFSGTRFISEFWRGQTLVWRSFRYYHLFCAIGLVVGIVELVIVRKYGDKISRYFNERIYFSKKLKEKIKY